MSVVLYATLAIVALLASAVIAYAQKSTLPAEQVLYSFQGLPDGAQPVGAVVFDSAGNLYGATTEGGSSSCISVAQCGTVYELSPPSSKGGSWTETVLYIFKGNTFNDGASPVGGLVMDSAGNLYGSTAYGGTGNCVLLGTLMGCGTVYELSPPTQSGGAWSEKVIYSFPDAAHGYKPNGDLTFDSLGNLYGATEFGGGYGTSCDPYFQYCGAIFELIPPQQQGGAWTEQVLYGFKGTARGALAGDGGAPNGGLVLDRYRNIYGTTMAGGFTGGGCDGLSVGSAGCGTVFKLVPSHTKGEMWTEEILYRFNGIEGADPSAGVVFDESGDLCGSAFGGGTDGHGTLFRVAPPSQGSKVWVESTLYNFDGHSAGGPAASLIFDPTGNLYGTSSSATNTDARGTVFRIQRTDQTFQIIHTFKTVPDGETPASPLLFATNGDLFGTTQAGGTGTTCGVGGCGTVFEVEP